MVCDNYFVVRNYHHGNLREVLILEGVKLIQEHGVSALTLREIGVRAGVSRTAAYRHFSDKAQLLAAISEAGFEEFAKALQAARSSSVTFADKLNAMGIAYLRFAGERRPYFEVMFGVGCDLGDRERSEAGERAFGVLEGMIQEAQESGDVRPGDAAMLAKVVWSLSHGMAMLQLETDYSGDGEGTKFVQLSTEILRTGLK